MNLDIPEIKEILESLKDIKKQLKTPVMEKAWYTVEECWQLKGGGALSTFQTNKKYQCKGGIPDGYVAGRKVWNRNSVEEWLQVTDDQIPEYLEKIKSETR